MNAPIAIRDFNGFQIKVYGTADEPLFLAKDVAAWIGHSTPHKLLEVVDESERGRIIVPTLGGNQELVCLTEDGLYEVLFQSRKPIAKTFKKAVKQMLGEIRRHGFTATEATLEQMIANPDLVIGLAQNLKNERERRFLAETTIQIQAPKVEYHDQVLASQQDHTTTTIAKELGMSAVTLNKKLHALGIQYHADGHWVLYHKYQDKGYTRTRTTPFLDDHGVQKTAILTTWTEAGRQFIHRTINPVFQPCN